MNVNWDLHRVTLVGLVLLVIPPIFFTQGSRTIPRLFTLMAIMAILTLALNIVFGHTDQLFLFTGAIAATGGYTTILLAEYLGVSPWFTMPIAAAIAGLIGALVSFVAARRGLGIIVISILTLALQFSIVELINSFRDITGGSTGLRVTSLTIEPLAALPFLDNQAVLYYTTAALLVALLLLYRYLVNSKYGLAFEMIRQDEDAAESIGVNVAKYKIIAGFIATFAVGLVGPLLAQRTGFLTPTQFSFGQIDVIILIMLIIGGLRTMYGPIVGAVVVVMINEQLREFGAYRLMVFGILLILLFLYFRRGIVPWVTSQAREYGIVERSRELISGS